MIDQEFCDDGYGIGHYVDGGDGAKEEQEAIIDLMRFDDGYDLGHYTGLRWRLRRCGSGGGGAGGGVGGWRMCMATLCMMMVLRCRADSLSWTGKMMRFALDSMCVQNWVASFSDLRVTTVFGIMVPIRRLPARATFAVPTLEVRIFLWCKIVIVQWVGNMMIAIGRLLVEYVAQGMVFCIASLRSLSVLLLVACSSTCLRRSRKRTPAFT
ncbi:unnamed protein product [Prorocentrum cordatum]|uniref:Uncharacterized protein n=1 Tax=Prorocentrum cordatum TaxID=2364126 RepID=A0ABN9QUQ1_9DINO|nr:unnamed protein product [Polarella glacialis]